MTRTVQILGTSKNLKRLPPNVAGVERWLSNDPAKYKVYRPSLQHWSRWFNLHSRRWMTTKYPVGFQYYRAQKAPRTVYFQQHWPDVTVGKVFPREYLQTTFATSRGPNRYFTCTVAWCVALAIVEGFTRIELWGFMLNDSKGAKYAHQRPCLFYWIEQARQRGIEVVYQEEMTTGSCAPGDPDAYDGPLYGYETKPEGVLVDVTAKARPASIPPRSVFTRQAQYRQSKARVI